MAPLMIGSQRRWERELRLKSKAAGDQLTVEIERTSRSAQSKMAQLEKEARNLTVLGNIGMNTGTGTGKCTSGGNPIVCRSVRSAHRLMVIEIIQDHNCVDVYRVLHQSSGIVNQNASKFISSKSIPCDRDLVVAMANIIFGAARLSPLSAVKALATLFRGMYGEKFFTWALTNNDNGIVDHRVVTKLTQTVEESLIDQYLKAIVSQPLSTEKAKPPTTTTITCDTTQEIARNDASPPSKPAPPKMMSTQNRHNSCLKLNPTSMSTIKPCSSIVSISKLAPTLPIRIFRPNPKLEIAFDVRTKNPVYAIEKLDGLEQSQGANIRHRFYEEDTLPLEYRSRLCSFIRSGYDRGHMAAAANYGVASVRDTFNLCNVSPQDQAMNRSTWVRLEHWCRKVAERELLQSSPKQQFVTGGRKSVFIVTGPVWLPKTAKQKLNGKKRQQYRFEYSALGTDDSLVHVPTHFFKVIVVTTKVGEVNERIQKFACFLVPNISPKSGVSLEEYCVHWDRLEAITGLQFFPEIATPTWKAAAKKVSPSNHVSGLSRKTSNDCIPSLASHLEYLRI